MRMDYVENIARSGLTIYDAVDPFDPYLYIPTPELQRIISDRLVGLSLDGYALRTRSKVVKTEICKALGYPVPTAFRKTQPRFLGQNFDVYNQQSRNVQIWNEDVDVDRRYVFVQIDEDSTVTAVKVITGDELARYDRTGKLTTKYQATMTSYGRNICSECDTSAVDRWIIQTNGSLRTVNPNSFPTRTKLLSIREVYERLLPMVGQSIDYLNAVQERNRGAELHAMICDHLGYAIYEDDGSYPDIMNQLLEVKLQTSPTIDLGLHSPEDGKAIIHVDDMVFYSEDIRYAIFDGEVCGNKIVLRNVYVVTGEDFTSYFPLFRGGGTNAKIQLPLPGDFFN